MQVTKRDDVNTVKIAKTANRDKKKSNICKFCKSEVISVLAVSPSGKKKNVRRCCG